MTDPNLIVQKKKCFYIQPDQKVENNLYRVSILKEDDSGHYPQDSFIEAVSLEEAEKIITKGNYLSFGLSEKECKEILFSTLGSDDEQDTSH